MKFALFIPFENDLVVLSNNNDELIDNIINLVTDLRSVLTKYEYIECISGLVKDSKYTSIHSSYNYYESFLIQVWNQDH